MADNDEPDAALAGRAVVHRAQAPADAPQKAEHAWLRENADEHLENHLPVHDAGGGAPIDVVELYRRPTAPCENSAPGWSTPRRHVADGEAPTVLILGKTGSGKDLVARALHCGDTQTSALEHDARAGARPGATVGARTGS